jgi:hypothetical protein
MTAAKKSFGCRGARDVGAGAGAGAGAGSEGGGADSVVTVGGGDCVPLG